MLRSSLYAHVTTTGNIFLQGTPQLNYILYEEPSGFAHFEPASFIWHPLILVLEETGSNQSLSTRFMLLVVL